MEEQKEDLLEQLKQEYPVGTKYINAADGKTECVVVKGNFRIIEKDPLTVYGDIAEGCIVYEGKKAKIISKPLAYGDTVVFDGPNGPLKYTISRNHLIYDHGLNSQIFTDLGISHDETYILCDEAYGYISYISDRGASWPTFKNSDYAAARRIIEKLHKLCRQAKEKSSKFKVGDIVRLKRSAHGVPDNCDHVIKTVLSSGYELKGTGIYKNSEWVGIFPEDILELVGEQITEIPMSSNKELWERFPVGSLVRPIDADGKLYSTSDYDFIVDYGWRIYCSIDKKWFAISEYIYHSHVGYIYVNGKYAEVITKSVEPTPIVDATPTVDTKALLMIELQEKYKPGVKFIPVDQDGRLITTFAPIEVKSGWVIESTNQTDNVWFTDGKSPCLHEGYIYGNGRYAQIYEETTPKTSLRFKVGDSVAIHPDSQYLEQGMDEDNYLRGVVTATNNHDSYSYCYVVQWPNGEEYHYREKDLRPWLEHLLELRAKEPLIVVDSTPYLIDESPAKLVVKTEGTAVKKLPFTRI